ncbi:MAG: hypothetical protein U0W40_02760 [Acidimicrobiia bacterium]
MRLKWVLLALVVVVIGGAVALVVVERPKLDDAQTAADQAWKPLTADDQLVARYQKLEGALSAFDAAGGAERSVSKDLHAALKAWNAALKDGDTAQQVEAANTVEAQGARLWANVTGSARFAEQAAVKDALAAWAGTKPPAAMIQRFNRASKSYEDARTDLLARPVALAMSYGTIPTFQLGDLGL